ncbi:MAG: circularly permuted type 2 ATP-grasp protein, partial [Bdellovibrionales bacterium]|nr:circularly permuted type 2 ATP-grasp protein [Oligoflexia bacterium]
MSIRSISIGLSCLISFVAWGQVSYDEVFDGEKVRPQYEEYWNIYSRKTEAEKEAFVRNSLKDFKGDNAVHSLPRILTQEESKVLRAGVDQRARALRKFLVEYYKDPKNYQLQQVVPENVVQSALKRSNEIPGVNMAGTHDFNFWYGPDIIRDANGVWRVVEDNTGFVGGMGDLKLARKTLKKNMP